MKPRLVLVVWQDAWFDFDAPEPTDRKDYAVMTVGFLVRKGPRFLSLAQEALPNDEGYRAVTHIPLAVIESVNYLDVGEEQTGGKKAKEGSRRKEAVANPPRAQGRRVHGSKP